MKKIVLFLLLVLSALAMSAQEPIRWRISVKMTSDTEGIVTIKALVGEGWHLYGTKLPDGGPKPTTFSFSGSSGVEFVGNLTASRPAEGHDDDMFGVKLFWWDADVQFTRKFKLTGGAGSKIVATMSYMACNNISCTPPKSQTLTYTFK